ncbi:single-stranded-DNA-specific exonuclease RecJ [Dictyobacter formicarum]|uniref:Single-stranded-DNA-specific exonuclease RecJ n=1 Tax=Dictyobacter formicarum TaxID=2778368 RepID=A0ABQ3VLU5_9CHLR|nr:single-stranded-DNA-specific exonuclease RecJ [Dictyobacter formicarum]GHO86760.1 single-stranded-DNA-specific exonuclease RecJ [Dictyobacter formicarum]
MELSSHLSSAWEVYPQLDATLFRAAEAASITAIQAQLLYNRGLKTVEEMDNFIHASYQETRDPFTLIDMPRAVARIRQALDQQEHITVYGDYDADGVTSSALLYRALRLLKQPNAILDYHIPHRLKDGCGLNVTALDTLKARGTQLIITTDCASSDVEQVEYARQAGIDVIITDHHHPPAERPQAYAMVNPWRPDCQYGERYLCGVGIAFKLTQALYRSYNRPVEDELALLDLVAIGTIADIAPLLGENHIYVRLGLQHLNETNKPGLKALIRNANLQPGKIRERDIAFGIAPCINAAGRMKEASIAFELLVTDDPEEADKIAEELRQLNIQRQQETETLMRNVREQAASNPDHAVVMVDGDDWHEGIIGLVAGKLAEELSKPVLVLSNDPATGLSRGSARSQKGFNIIEALRNFASYLERYGGHAQAAGFTILSKRIEQLREHLFRWQENGGPANPALIEGTDLPDPTGIVTEQESSETAPTFMPRMVDLTITKARFLNYDAYKALRQLGPFGAGNPEPVFKMEKVNLLDVRTSGPNRQNLSFRFGFARQENNQAGSQHPTRYEQVLRGTYTRGAAEIQRFKNIQAVNIIFRLNSSEDDDKPETWLKILDAEPLYDER